MPNEKEISEMERRVAEVCIKLKISSTAVVDSALLLARTARDSRPSPVPSVRAVRPSVHSGDMFPEGEMTKRFASWK